MQSVTDVPPPSVEFVHFTYSSAIDSTPKVRQIPRLEEKEETIYLMARTTNRPEPDNKCDMRPRSLRLKLKQYPTKIILVNSSFGQIIKPRSGWIVVKLAKGDCQMDS